MADVAKHGKPEEEEEEDVSKQISFCKYFRHNNLGIPIARSGIDGYVAFLFLIISNKCPLNFVFLYLMLIIKR